MRFVTLLIATALLQASDAGLLQTGTFHYQTRIDGKDAGTSDISIRRSDEKYIFTNRVSGAFQQQWEAIATAAFVPISATLSRGDGEHQRTAFSLKYQDGRVTGLRLDKAVAADVPPDTVDQRIDWAAAMAQESVAGRKFAFHVYDPGTGSSAVTGEIVGPETVRVPAGSFDAIRIRYRIEKASGAEVYQVLTPRAGLRILLKEEFPDGAVTELMSRR